MGWEDTGYGSLRFNSGDFECDMVMGKLVDDDQDGIEFREVVTLNDMWVTCQLIQSIHNSFITLTVEINESKHLLEKFGTKGLQGEEFIKLKMQTPTRELIEDMFYVTGYEPITADNQEQVNSIVLKAVAKERLINSLLTINKSFEGSYHTIAANIFKNALLDSEHYKKMLEANKDGNTFWKIPNFYADSTDSVDKFIIPGVTPFKAINRIAGRSFGGSGYPGSLFNFYQTNHGFHFSNIEKRIAQEPWDIFPPGKFGPLEKFNPSFFKSSGDEKKEMPFTYDPELNDVPRYDMHYFKNIKSMSAFDITNTLAKIDRGSLVNTVRNIQPLKKTFTETTFNIKEEYLKFKRTGNLFNMSTKFFDTFADDPVEYTVVSEGSRFDDSERHEDYLDKTLGRRNAYIELFATYKYIINVYGDTSLNVGEIIELKLRETGVVVSKPAGSMYSGKYFITDLKHVWDKGSFNTDLGIVKDSPEFLHRRSTDINPATIGMS